VYTTSASPGSMPRPLPHRGKRGGAGVIDTRFDTRSGVSGVPPLNQFVGSCGNQFHARPVPRTNWHRGFTHRP
jgi:hypothetical protein